LIVKTFVFKPKLGIMFLKHQCFIAQWIWLSTTCLHGVFLWLWNICNSCKIHATLGDHTWICPGQSHNSTYYPCNYY
jgi:hypothetical protein